MLRKRLLKQEASTKAAFPSSSTATQAVGKAGSDKIGVQAGQGTGFGVQAGSQGRSGTGSTPSTRARRQKGMRRSTGLAVQAPTKAQEDLVPLTRAQSLDRVRVLTQLEDLKKLRRPSKVDVVRLLSTGRSMLPMDPEQLLEEGAALLARTDEEGPPSPDMRKLPRMRPDKGTVPARGGNGGKPRTKVTDNNRRIVKLCSAAGQPQNSIAAFLGVSLDALRTHYAYELDHGRHEYVARYMQRLSAIALHGYGKEAVTALIFLLKAVGGFREEAQRVDVDVNVTGHVQHDHVLMTNEERANRMLQLINAGRAPVTLDSTAHKAASSAT